MCLLNVSGHRGLANQNQNVITNVGIVLAEGSSTSKAATVTKGFTN